VSVKLKSLCTVVILRFAGLLPLEREATGSRMNPENGFDCSITHVIDAVAGFRCSEENA
jgi:hypothetical protein